MDNNEKIGYRKHNYKEKIMKEGAWLLSYAPFYDTLYPPTPPPPQQKSSRICMGDELPISLLQCLLNAFARSFCVCLEDFLLSRIMLATDISTLSFKIIAASERWLGRCFALPAL